MKYPKIETLYDRNMDTFKVITDKVRKPEFDAVKYWTVTEKIDGTNIRVLWNKEAQTVTFGGRTDNAQIPAKLFTVLQATFTPDKFATFTDDVILFGEGYGEKIQNGGAYRSGVSFRLFDVLIGRWWIEQEDIVGIGDTFGVCSAPQMKTISYLPLGLSDLIDIVGNESKTALQDGGQGCKPEGIVARSKPMLFDRAGNRVMWKLKFKDF
jgi:hypothetical protein